MKRDTSYLRLFLFSIFFFFSTSIFSIPIDWVGGEMFFENDWNRAANWFPPRVPTAADDVTIPFTPNAPTLDIDVTGGNAIASLTIEDGATLTTGNFSLEVLGDVILGTTFVVTLDASGQTTASVDISGNVSGTGVFTAAAGTVTIGGNVTVGTFTASSGSTTVTGNLTSATFNANGGSITFDGGGTSTVGAGAGYTFNDVTVTGAVDAASDWTVNGAGGLTVTGVLLDMAGNSLTVVNAVGGTGTLTLAAGAHDLQGNVSVATINGGAGTVDIAGNLTSTTATFGAGNVTVAGNVTAGTFTASSNSTTVTGNLTSAAFNANGGSITFDGGGTSTVGAGAGYTFNDVTVTGAVDAASDWTVNGAGGLTVTGVLLDMAGNSLTVVNAVGGTGTLSLAAGAHDLQGNVSVATINGGAGTVDIGGNLTSTTATFAAGNVTVAGNVTAGTFTASSNSTTVTGNLTSAAFNANGGTITFDGGGTSTVGAGAGYTFNDVIVTGAVDAASDWTVNGAGGLTVTGVLLDMGANDLTVANNVAGTGTLDGGSGTVDITGNVTVSTFDASSTNTTVTGNITSNTFNGNGGTITLDGGGTSTVGAGAGYNFSDVIITGNVDAGADWNATSVTINGSTLDMGANDLTITNNVGGTGTLDSGNGTTDVTGNVTVATFTASSGNTTVGGNLTSATFNNGGGTITFDAPAGSNVGAGGGYTFNNVVVTSNTNAIVDWNVQGLTINGSTLDMGANDLTVANNVTGTGILDSGNGTVDITGNVTVATFTASSGNTTVGGNLTSGTFNNSGGTITFDGGGTSTVGAGAGYTFNDVTVTGAVDAASDWTVNGAGGLTVTGVLLDMAGNSLTVVNAVGGTGTLTLAAGAHDLQGNVSVATINGGAGTVDIAGNLTSTTATFGAGNVTVAGNVTAGTFTASSNSTTVTGNLTSAAFNANGGSITFDGGGTSTVGAGAGYTFNDVTVTGAVDAASDWTVNGAGGLTVTGVLLDMAGNSLTVVNAVGGTGTLSLAAGAHDLQGNVSVATINGGAGTVDIGGNLTSTTATFAAGNVTVAGNVTAGTFTASSNSTTVTGNLTSAAFNANGGTITFDGGGTSTVGAGAGYTFNDVIVTGAVDAASDWTVNGAGGLTVTGVLLDMAGNSLTVVNAVGGTGTLTLAAGAHDLQGNVSVATINGGAGTVDIGGNLTSTTATFGAGAVSIDGNVGPNIDFTESSTATTFNGGSVDFSGGSFTDAGGEVIFDSGGGTNLDSNGAYFDATVNAGTTVTLQSDMTVTGTLTVDGNILVGTHVLTISNTTNLTNVDFGTGTLAIGGTLTLTVAAPTELYDLTVTGAGDLTLGADLTVNRNVLVAGGGAYNSAGNTLILGGVGAAVGSITDGNGGTVNFGAVEVNNAAKTMGSDILVDSLDVSSSSLDVGASTLTVNGLAVVAGTLTNDGGGTVDLGGTLTVTGTLDNGNGGSRVEAAGDVVFGPLSYTNGGLLYLDGGVVRDLTSGGNNLGTVEVDGAGANMQDDTTYGNVTITAGTLSTGDFSFDALSVVATGTLNASGQATPGNDTQITGVLSGAGSAQFGAQPVTIGGNVTINTFTAGAGDVDINGGTVNVATMFTESDNNTNIAATTVTFGGFTRAVAGLLTFDAGAAVTLTSGGQYSDVVISAATTVNQTNNTDIGINLNNDGILNIAGNNLTIAGNVDNDGSITSTGGAFTVSGNIDHGSNNAHAVTLGGTLTLTGNFNHNDGSVTFQNIANINGNYIQANIAETFRAEANVNFNGGAATYTFNGNVELDGVLTLDSTNDITFGNAAGDTLILSGGAVTLTDGGAGSDLTINSQLSGAQNLTLNFAGTSSVNNTVNIGVVAAAGIALTIASNGDTTFADTVQLSNSTGGSLSVTGNGNVWFQDTLTAGEGLLQANALAGTLRFDENVTINGAGVATDLRSTVRLDGLTFTTDGDAVFGNAAADLLRLSNGPVVIQTGVIGSDFTLNADVWSDGTPRNFSVDAGNGVIGVNADLGAAVPGEELAVIDFDADIINISAATINSSAAQTYDAITLIDISSGTNTGGSTITFTAPDIDVSSGDIASSGDISFSTTGRTYIALTGNTSYDAGGMGNDLVLNDVFINIADAATLSVEDVGSVSTDNFYFFGGGLDFITTPANHTDLTVNGDFVALGYADNDSIEDPHRGAVNNTLWAYPGLAAITALQAPSYASTNFADFSDANGFIRLTVSGNFYVNEVDLPGAVQSWELYLPDNVGTAAAPNPVADTDPDTNTSWGTPYALSINNNVSWADVDDAAEVVIAANIPTQEHGATPINAVTDSDVYDLTIDTPYPIFDPSLPHDDAGRFTNYNSTAFVPDDNERIRDADVTFQNGFDTTQTWVSNVSLVKDDVAMIEFSRPIMNYGNEITEALASGFFTIDGQPVLGTAYLAPYWPGEFLPAQYGDPKVQTEPLLVVTDADFYYLERFFVKTAGATWATDSAGNSSGGAGAGTDSEGAAPVIGDVDIQFGKGLFRGSNGADFVYADIDGAGDSGDADANVWNDYDDAIDFVGPVLYSVEVGRMRDTGDGQDGHNFFTLYFSENVQLSGASPTATIGGGNYRADDVFDNGGNIGGEFRNDQFDFDFDASDEEAVYVEGYFWYSNDFYGEDNRDPPFISGDRNDPGNFVSDGTSANTISSLYALNDRTVRIFLAGYQDGPSSWPGWHFLVPDPYADTTVLEVEQNNNIDDGVNTIDALESTRSMMATLNAITRPDGPPDFSGPVVINTPFDSHGFVLGNDFDFWDVSAPVVSASSTSGASTWNPADPDVLRDFSPDLFESALIEDPATLLIAGFDIFVQDNALASTGAFQRSEDNLSDNGNWDPNTEHDQGNDAAAPFSNRPYFMSDTTPINGLDIPSGGSQIYRGIRDSSAQTIEDAISVGFRDGSLLDPSTRVLNTLGGAFDTNTTGNQLYRPDESPVSVADDPYFNITIADVTGAGWDNLAELFMYYDHRNNGYITDLAGNLMPSSDPDIMQAAFGSVLYRPYSINPFPDGTFGETGRMDTLEVNPPNIRLSLAAVDADRLFIRFSEPVWGDVARTTQIDATDFGTSGILNVINLEIVKENFDFSSTGGVEEAYLYLDGTLTADDLFSLDLTLTDTIYDKALNSRAMGFARPITDVGIGIIAPVWATDGIQLDGTRGGGFTTLRVFDGSEGLDDLDITIESAITAPSFLGLPVNLFFDVNVIAGAKSARENGAVGDFWSPIGITGLIETPNTEARIANRIAWNNLTGISQHLIPAGDPEVERGNMLEFFYRVGPLMAATVDNPNNPLDLEPFRIDLGAVEVQRGGVTILSNVINPEAGDETIINYVLERQGMVVVNVFTLDGDLVRVLQRGRQGTGTYNLPWDGRNSNGDIVARGFYFIRVVGPGVDEVRKVLIVK
jgi:hypothetical protein